MVAKKKAGKKKVAKKKVATKKAVKEKVAVKKNVAVISAEVKNYQVNEQQKLLQKTQISLLEKKVVKENTSGINAKYFKLESWFISCISILLKSNDCLPLKLSR